MQDPLQLEGLGVPTAPGRIPEREAAERSPEDGRRPSRERGADVLPFPTRVAAPEPWGSTARSSVLPAAPPPESELVRASLFGVAWRLVELAVEIVWLQLASWVDRLTYRVREMDGRRSARDRTLPLVERRAVRLRKAVTRLGGTFIKLGQQLAIRSDVLPPVYCEELGELLDNVPPIDEAYVRQTILEHAGRPLEECFAWFEFPPIGSASVACVYRARLPSGELVAVKVRRPRIMRVFKTDLAALDLVLRVLEFLTILRPRVTGTLRSEMRLMLLEELDFQVEARYQELFRVYFKRRRKLRTTAPRVYPELSGREIIVSEYVTGIWLKDLLASLDTVPGYRDYLRQLDISPRKIAKQLIRGSHYSFFECPFFHGDPHPGNVLVQPGNRIVLVDFGACGVFAHRERYQLAQMHDFQSNEDVGGMVQCVIGLMEPLPPIDIDAFRRRLEEAWWKGFYGIKSKHAQWWERTSFRLWTALFREVRAARIPLPLNMLRMIRATLLYDSVAARLYRRIDVFGEYRWYFERYARHVRDGVHKAILRQLVRGPDPANYVRLGRLWEVGNLALQQAQVLLRRPLPDFAALVSKGWEVVRLTIKWALASTALTLVAFLIGLLQMRDRLQTVSTVWDYPGFFLRELQQDMGTPGTLHGSEAVLIAWTGLILLVFLKYLRAMWFRLDDRDVYSNGSLTGRR
jgi:predicted unusual protein kinase regulating ubiquinone biosynthesis (AarF/ABC1/UbiB family)